MKRFIAPIIVTILVAVMGIQMFLAAKADGATTDEQIHILSGYSTITQAHILFDPEHPFLAKAISALPLLFMRPTIPEAAAKLDMAKTAIDYNTYAEANAWGYQMLYEMGNDPALILLLTRTMIIGLTLLLAISLWKWTKSLFGPASAIAALTLLAFDPSFIAHGHLANNDTAAVLMFLLTLACFHRFLIQPSYRHLVLTGLSLGASLLTKFSLVILGPIMVALLAAWFIFHRHRGLPAISMLQSLRQPWLRYTLGLAGIFALSWVVVWIGYGTLMVINPDYNPQSMNFSQVPDWLEQLISHTVPLMWGKGAYYLFGPDAHGRDGYLLGQCYTGGRWDYFFTTAGLKIPVITLTLFAATLAMWWHRRHQSNFIPFLLLIPMVIYLGVSSQSHINIGFRHILPVYAFIIIAASYPYSQVDWSKFWSKIRSVRSIIDLKALITDRQSLIGILLVAALVGIISIGLRTFPYYLPYYNFLSGEPRPIPYISSDSNIDWGQGTLALKQYIEDNGINRIAFDNFTGTGEARYYGLPLANISPSDTNYTGYLALSRSAIIDHKCTKDNDWGWVVDHHQPIDIIAGGAINIYYLE